VARVLLTHWKHLQLHQFWFFYIFSLRGQKHTCDEQTDQWTGKTDTVAYYDSHLITKYISINLFHHRLYYTPCPEKKSLTLSIVTWRKDTYFSSFLVRIFLAQLAIKWLFNILPHPMSVPALLGENRTNKLWVKMNEIYIKKYPQHYWPWLEERLTDFNNFWCKHFWHYLASNDRFSSHLSKCLLLHYPGKPEQVK